MKMRQWLDVLPGDWFYNEVMEASNYLLEDGDPLISGFSYNRFSAPKVYEEFEGDGGRVEFTLTLPEDVEPSTSNPLYVYVDGVQTIYKAVTGTAVTLYAPPRAGSRVTVMMQGKPWVDVNGRPEIVAPGVYPSKDLDNASSYYWNPLDGRHLEYCYAYGKALRRAPIPVDEWNVSDPQALVEKYIGSATDMYAISPSSHPYAPGRLFLSMNLNNVTCSLIYYSKESDGTIVKRGGEFAATSPMPLWNDRYFPDARITRAEAYALICRMRDSFYSRFTDTEPPNGNFTESHTAYDGQRAFKLLHRFQTGGTGLKVLNAHGVQYDLGDDYVEFNDHTILFNLPLSAGSRITFVGTYNSKFPDLDSNAWYYRYIAPMEIERFGDGSPLITGRPNPEVGGPDIFAPDEMLQRSEAGAFLNRFRKWCIERFKY
jgi:hypothetical protein